MLLALVLPTSGVLRGLDAIRRHAIIGGSPLHKAQKAGALCEVVRTKTWKPQPGPGDVVRRVEFKRTRDEHNLAIIKAILEPRKRWVTNKLSWLKRLNIQRDTKLDQVALKVLDREVPGVKSLLYGEGRLVRWYFYVATGLTTRITSKPDSLELLDLPQRTRNLDTSEKQTILPPFTIFPKIRIVGLGRRRSFIPSYKMLDLNGRKIHGSCCLPPGYELAIVQPQSTVLELNDEKMSKQQSAPSGTETSNEISPSVESDISWSYSFVKGLVAILQALYACVTLYETRGDQIERYGYAAFGLTVAPYLVMSIVNLIGTVLTPDYSTLFMVESNIMEEARERNGACFVGAVGKLVFKRPITPSFDATFKIDNNDGIVMEVNGGSANTEEAPPSSIYQDDLTDNSPTILIPSCHDASDDACRERDLFHFASRIGSLTDTFIILAATGVGLVSVAINGALSHFHAGDSTHAQRVWTMTWLAVGIFYGTSEPIFDILDAYDRRYRLSVIGRLQMLLFGCGPAFGGFVVVGQMLVNYGRCIQISTESL